MKKKKRRLKKQVYYVLIGIIVFIIAIILIINRIKYVNSYPYKLGKIGYNEEQIEVILKNDNEIIDDILKRKYSKNIVTFMKEKYFIYKNLDRYLAYYKENRKLKKSLIVSLVNVGADHEWYDEEMIKETDTSLNELMLVNKFYHLKEDWVPKDIKEVSSIYAYDENATTDVVMKAFKEMWSKAKDEDLTLIITSSYRDYKTQDEIWNRYADSNSEEWADGYAARAGYSEHQTGLALDIVTYNSTMDDFEKSAEFKWLSKNAYKYGFILRYPKGKENITGYDYESWHYRYVGKDVAKKINDLGITFDEYYAYYIENKA